MIQHQLLAGKRGVVFGALDENSIAWHVATQCVAEGARITLTNAPVAMRFGTIQKTWSSIKRRSHFSRCNFPSMN